VSRAEKAEKITKWFSDNNAPKYANYKQDINGSDIIEYTNVKRAIKTGGNIEDLIA
jgi:hypothetical protein